MWPCDPKITQKCVPLPAGRPDQPSDQFLRQELIQALTPRADSLANDAPAARFEFRVQLQDPNQNMPVEDASIAWSQEISPYRRVAVLTIPPQRFSSEAQNRFCENLSFNPWHGLPAHRPIGGLNRARRVLYEAISEARHAHNGVTPNEPRGFCLRLDGQPCETTLAEGLQP